MMRGRFQTWRQSRAGVLGRSLRREIAPSPEKVTQPADSSPPLQSESSVDKEEVKLGFDHRQHKSQTSLLMVQPPGILPQHNRASQWLLSRASKPQVSPPCAPCGDVNCRFEKALLL